MVTIIWIWLHIKVLNLIKNLEKPMKLDKNINEKIKDKNKKIIEIRPYFYKKILKNTKKIKIKIKRN